MNKPDKKENPSIILPESTKPGEEQIIHSQSKNFWNVLIVLLFVLLGFILYSNIFHSPFQFDDTMLIVKNKHVHIKEVTPSSIMNVLKGPLGFRSLTMISFALNYYFGRDNVVGYHVVNVVIHVVTGIVLFFLFEINTKTFL